MKRILTGLTIALVAIIASAQDQIQFKAGNATVLGDHTTLQKEKLENKVTQILGRNSAGAGDGTYVIEPVLEVCDMKQSEGLVRNVMMATAEFTLNTKNAETGGTYYSVTIPLEVAITCDSGDVLDAILNGIKVKDPAYTRFIRNSRKKIAETLPAPEDTQVPTTETDLQQ